MQLQRLAVHPFEDEIDTCEHLLSYIAKNMIKRTTAGGKDDAKTNIDEAARKKKLEEYFIGSDEARTPDPQITSPTI